MNKAISAICLLSGVLSASASVLPLPPFTYVGRIVDAAHASAKEVTVRAWNARGELVAKTTTYENGVSARNYRLTVPMATAAASGHATVGETLSFEVCAPAIDGVTTNATYASLVPAGKCVVGNPGDVVTCDFMAAEASSVAGVSSAYLAAIRGEMRRAGRVAWDSAADWDDDGMSNYAEYVAGTSPFDAKSKLAVASFETASRTDGKRRLALTFTPVAGRVYSVGATHDLNAGGWSRVPFAASADAEATLDVLNVADETPRTFYVPIDESRPSGFYRLTVE